MEEGGYRERSLWLADGWEARVAGGWEAPLHWIRQGGGFAEFSLAGLAPLAPAAPVVHVSHFEADAFARWREARLPTEFEWESAAADQPVTGTLLEDGRLQPPTRTGGGPSRGVRPGAALRRCLGVDGEPLSPLPPGSGRPAGSASRAAGPCPGGWCSAAGPASPRPPTSARATATSSAPTRAGRRRASASPATRDGGAGLERRSPTGTRGPQASARRNPTRPYGTPRPGTPASRDRAPGLERRSPTGTRGARSASARRNPTRPYGTPGPARRHPVIAPPAWNAGLRPASRGSAKPAPMAQRHANSDV